MNDFVNAFIHKYPFQTLHELNLDWIISAMKELAVELNNFEAANTIHYAGAFDITKQYPAWSVVVDNNFGYISTKPVPAGIAVTNTEYWENIADFSALYADLGSRVTALENADIAIRSDISKINDKLSMTWRDREILFLGDSYGRGRTYPNTYGNSWVDQVAWNLQPKSYQNLSVSQASFSPNNTDTLRYGYQLKTFVESHTEADCNKITDIVICGGYNEVFTPGSDLVNTNADYCAKWTYNYVKQYFPNARVFLGFIGRVPIFGGAQATFNNFADAIAQYKTIARSYGFTYLVGSEYMSHIYDHLTSDGIHFKTTGYLEIGKRIANCLNDGAWIPPQAPGSIIEFIPCASSANNSIVATNNTIELYNQYTESGIEIFTTANTALTVTCAATQVTSTSPITIGKYYDVASEKYSRFVMQYNKRYRCSFALIYNDTIIDTYEGFIYLEPTGEIKIAPLAGNSFTETIDKIYIAQQDIFVGYSNC